MKGAVSNASQFSMSRRIRCPRSQSEHLFFDAIADSTVNHSVWVAEQVKCKVCWHHKCRFWGLKFRTARCGKIYCPFASWAEKARLINWCKGPWDFTGVAMSSGRRWNLDIDLSLTDRASGSEPPSPQCCCLLE